MRPIVIALTGLPGTGKTTLGAMVFRRLPSNFAYLDLDTLTQPLVRAALEVNGLCLATAAGSGALRLLRDAQYACLFDQARELVAFGRNVLLVAPMTHELEDPPSFRRFVDRLRPARFILIRTHASCESVRDRLEQRGHFLDELRLARWDADRYRYESPVPLPITGLELDTTARSSESLAEQVLGWLAPQLGSPGSSEETRSEASVDRMHGPVGAGDRSSWPLTRPTETFYRRWVHRRRRRGSGSDPRA